MRQVLVIIPPVPSCLFTVQWQRACLFKKIYKTRYKRIPTTK